MASTSAFAPSEASAGAQRAISGVASGRIACALALAVLGVFSILSTGLSLWDLWVTDPLKSIGAFVPVVSLLLIVRVWRSLGWEVEGTWWGLVLLAATVALVHWRDHGMLELVLSPSWALVLPPHSLVVLAYGTGVVLLFGGVRLLRAALFPVLLLLLVNPVPHAFNNLVDLPLQHLAATAARACAEALGQRLSPDQLRLMFTPRFGMFIAPGCDGIRGAVTMGLLALVTGYLYRMRLRRWALFVAAAVLLGYLFNLVRLCVLVVYYVVALWVPVLQGRAERADYLIGATLFFCATLLLFAVLRRASPAGDLRPPALPRIQEPPAAVAAVGRFWWRWACFALLVALGSVSYARALLAAGTPQLSSAPAFPTFLGPYQRQRTWQEQLPGGTVLFNWATYTRPGQPEAVSIGLAPLLGAHDTLICHAARGETWSWHGALTEPTLDGPVRFSGTLLTNGAAQTLEATTLCAGSRCGEFTSSRRHLGLVYSRPPMASVLRGDPAKPVPVLLKLELPDPGLPVATAQRRLEMPLRDFLAHASLVSLARPYRTP